jgi:hypothetical protein
MIARRLTAMVFNAYPRYWRTRYGDEFAATLEQMRAVGWSTLWDITKGAIAMQIHYNGVHLTRTVAVFGIVGLALASAGSFAIRNLYASEALFGDDSKSDALRLSMQKALTRPRLHAIIEKERLYEKQSPDKAIEMMQKHISISNLDRSRMNGDRILVGFVYPDAAVSQRVTADLVEAIINEHGRRLNLLDGPRLIDGPIYPNRTVIAFIGLLSGTLLGGLWCLVRARPVRLAPTSS